jgi:hypothetical protein
MSDDDQAGLYHQWELEQQQQLEEAVFSEAFFETSINTLYTKEKLNGKIH